MTWLAAPRCRELGTCSSDLSASVELLGAWEEQAIGRDAIELVWTTISDDGVPRALSARALGRGAPAVAAVADAGYVVAYAAEGGGASLAFVDALEDPPEVESTAPYRSALPSMTRRTSALVVHAEQPLRAGATVSELDVAAASSAGANVTLGIAFIEGGAPFFVLASLSTSDGAITASDPISLGAGPASAPSIVFGESACGAGCAGWAIAFERAGSVWVARVGVGGALLGEVARAGGESARFPRVMVSAGGALRAGWYEPGQSAFVRSSGLCPGG